MIGDKFTRQRPSSRVMLAKTLANAEIHLAGVTKKRGAKTLFLYVKSTLFFRPFWHLRSSLFSGCNRVTP